MSTEPANLTLAVGDQTLAYWKAGQGPAVAIVHGIGGRKEDFAAVVASLAERHTVLAMDMIGFGASSKTSATVTIGMQAGALAALLEAEGVTTADVIGNSLGAWVVAMFAAAHPEMTGKVVMIDAAGLGVTLQGPPPVNFAPDTVEEMEQLLATVLDSDFAHSRAFAEQALAGFKAGGEAATLGKLFAGFGHTSDKVLDEVLPQVKAPAIVVWGANDRLFPAALADVVAQGLGGAPVHLIPNASHFPQIDNPAALNAVLSDFLG